MKLAAPLATLHKAVAVVVALAVVGCAGGAFAQTALYVSPNGNDQWSGQLAEADPGGTDGPLATLDRARELIRQFKEQGPLPAGGVVVHLRGGRYELTRPFELSAADSGTEQSPIVYRAFGDEEVRISGGRLVDRFAPLEAKVAARLETEARKHVVQAELAALGIREYGNVDRGAELYFDDRPMTLARWPNEGFVKIVDVVGDQPVDVRGTKGDRSGKFVYDGDRPQRWADENDVWLYGYWFWDWSAQRQRVASIDFEQRLITLRPPLHSYGYRKGQWFFAQNVLAELDAPGEWYLDRTAGVLYFWPPTPIEQGQAVVSVLDDLLVLREVSHVRLERLIIEACRGDAVTVTGGAANAVAGCTIRNTGGRAVRVTGGAGHAVVGCDVTHTGNGGIALSGGDRKSLTPSGHLAQNNHIHHYARWNRMYQPGIAISGVGQQVRNNRIHDAPHQAISFSGNDHWIELNEIYRVCTESNDAGAIYSGRDWTMRGTRIRFNYLHEITGLEGRGCVGVYLDDMFSGVEIVGNVFDRVTRAAFVGGGRDVTIDNNIFVDCKPAVHVDARAMTWASYHVDTTMRERLEAMPYREPLWAQRYPRLTQILDRMPAAPRGNAVTRNICVGGRFDEVDLKALPFVRFDKNLVDKDPRFVDRAGKNFQLEANSPAFKLGFKPIPFEKIGLYVDAYRRQIAGR